jgi:hypothetical protein
MSPAKRALRQKSQDPGGLFANPLPQPRKTDSILIPADTTAGEIFCPLPHPLAPPAAANEAWDLNYKPVHRPPV